jgi:hypothetical protein
VNAVLPAVSVAFRRTHQHIAMRFADTVKKYDPSLELGERETEHLLKFIKRASVGLNLSDRLKLVPIVASGVAVILSFFGLGFSATQPEYVLSSGLVWSFSIYSLIFCPALVVLYEMWLKFVERGTIAKWAGNKDKIAEIAETFKLVLGGDLLLDKVHGMLYEQQREREKRAMAEFSMGTKRWIESIKSKVRFYRDKIDTTFFPTKKISD